MLYCTELSHSAARFRHSNPVFTQCTECHDEQDSLFYMYLQWRKKKLYWLHPYIQRNINCHLFVAAKELTEPGEKFQCMSKMTKIMFQELVMVISPAITIQNTNIRQCVSAEERILTTLR